MNCKCGFKFAGPGEFRNCDAFITKNGESGVICPKCQTHYVGGKEMEELKPNFIKIEPKPHWEEEPVKTETPREWVGRYRYLRQGSNGEPDVDVDVDVHYAPENYPDATPMEIDGEWVWDIEQRSK